MWPVQTGPITSAWCHLGLAPAPPSVHRDNRAAAGDWIRVLMIYTHALVLVTCPNSMTSRLGRKHLGFPLWTMATFRELSIFLDTFLPGLRTSPISLHVHVGVRLCTSLWRLRYVWKRLLYLLPPVYFTTFPSSHQNRWNAHKVPEVPLKTQVKSCNCMYSPTWQTSLMSQQPDSEMIKNDSDLSRQNKRDKDLWYEVKSKSWNLYVWIFTFNDERKNTFRMKQTSGGWGSGQFCHWFPSTLLSTTPYIWCFVSDVVLSIVAW